MSHSIAMLAVIWRPVWPPLYVYAAAVVLAGFTAFAFARTFRGLPVVSVTTLVMRLLVIAAFAVLLMGPSDIPAQIQRKTRPKLCIMLDTSESMQTTDCNGESRMHAATHDWLSPQRLQALAAEYDLDLRGFDTQVRPLPASRLQQSDAEIATGRWTQLGGSLTQALLKLPANADGQSMLVISDGHDSADEPIQPAASLAKSRHVPIHTVCLGGSNLQRDIALLAVPMQEYLLAKEPGEIVVKVYQVGLDQSATTVHVRCGQEHQILPVQFNGRRVVELKVPIKQDEPGQYEYAVHVDSLDGEVETNNNNQSVFCNVTRQRIKVLIVEGQPYWDTKFLAQSLRKDDRVEVTQITQLSTRKRETIITRSEDSAPGVPSSSNEFAKYDVVILGHDIQNVIDAEQAALLREFVSGQGGHVILARGIPYDPNDVEGRRIGEQLSELEPVNWGDGVDRDLSLALTSSGRTSLWLSPTKMGTDVEGAIARLPGFTLMPRIADEKPAAVVLLRARGRSAAPVAPNIDEDGAPALATMSYGRGSVVAILGEGLWQWSLLERQRHDLAGFYDLFWSNLVRWLAMGGDFQPGQEVSLKLARGSVYIGDPMTIDVVYKLAPDSDAHPAVIVADPAGKASEVPLHRLPGRDPRFRATINPPTAGVYRVALHTPELKPQIQECGFSAYDVSLERLETSANPMVMAVLAEHTGGEAFKPNQADLLMDKLERRRLATIVPVEPEYIWDKGVILFVLLLWAGLEWIVRRKAGLL